MLHVARRAVSRFDTASQCGLWGNPFLQPTMKVLVTWILSALLALGAAAQPAFNPYAVGGVATGSLDGVAFSQSPFTPVCGSGQSQSACWGAGRVQPSTWRPADLRTVFAPVPVSFADDADDSTARRDLGLDDVANAAIELGFPVPEPDIYVLVLAGLVAVTFTARRRIA